MKIKENANVVVVDWREAARSSHEGAYVYVVDQLPIIAEEIADFLRTKLKANPNNVHW